MATQTAKESSEMNHPNLELMFSEEQIKARVAEIGRQITREYAGKELVLIGVLKGSVIFLSDLMREIDLKLSI